MTTVICAIIPTCYLEGASKRAPRMGHGGIDQHKEVIRIKIIVEITSNEFSDVAKNPKIVSGLEALVRRRLQLKEDDTVAIRIDPKDVSYEEVSSRSYALAQSR